MDPEQVTQSLERFRRQNETRLSVSLHYKNQGISIRISVKTEGSQEATAELCF